MPEAYVAGSDPSFARIACLNDLDEPLRRELVESAVERRLERGAVLVRQGDPFAGLLIVVSGRLVLTRLEEDGRETRLRTLGPGDCHCLTPGDDAVCSAVSVECVRPARLLVIEQPLCDGLLADRPAVARGVMRCLAERANAAITHGGRQVESRVISALLDIGDRDGVAARDGLVIQGIRQDELAAHAGTVREVAARVLARLRRSGIIRTGRQYIVIRDAERLRELVRGD